MARPKKVSTKDMLRILESYMEKHGDVSKLKCSNLEKYATSLGVAVKAYDFRRDEAVRQRIDELIAEVKANNSSVTGSMLVYKNLDADALIANHPTKATLKAALLELDANWWRIYERSVSMSAENTALISENNSKKQTIKELTEEISQTQDEIKSLKRLSGEQQAVIRYLKNALETYLYPALANKILHREGVLEEVDTVASAMAVADMTEIDSPISFTEAIASDKELLTREQKLLARMKSQVSGGNKNEKQFH